MKTIELIVKENENVVYPYVWTNNNVGAVNVQAILEGNNASLLLCGIFLGTENSSATFNTHVEHRGRNTRSLTTIRGVFTHMSSFSNDGMVRINKGAKGTDGYFQSKILLFDDAKGRSVPSLEIDENEVKAGHGSTVGRPDPEQIFYMKSRGISEKQAELLLIKGFFDPLVSLLPLEDKKNTEKIINNFLKTYEL